MVRWYTKKKLELPDGRILWYVGSCTIRSKCKKFVDKERRKAGKTKIVYRIKKEGKKFRTFVGRAKQW